MMPTVLCGAHSVDREPSTDTVVKTWIKLSAAVSVVLRHELKTSNMPVMNGVGTTLLPNLIAEMRIILSPVLLNYY